MKKVIEMRNERNDNRADRKVQWRVIDTHVRGNAAIQVSELPLKVPRFSFRVGTPQYDEATGQVRISPNLTVFNVIEAAALLQELGEKYTALREEKIEHFEALKEKWQQTTEKQ